jgi:nucleotide-binding universal stress UspA family protein
VLRRILVPIDGSPLAEHALERAAELATAEHFASGSGACRLRSAPPTRRATGLSPGASVPSAVPTELMTVPGVDVQLAWDASFDVKEAEAYLSLVTERLTRQGADPAIHAQVQVGELIQQVLAFQSTADIGLIVMATHGRSRLAEALRGSTLDDMLQATPCPLVIVHPRGESPDWWSTDRVTRPPER